MLTADCFMGVGLKPLSKTPSTLASAGASAGCFENQPIAWRYFASVNGLKLGDCPVSANDALPALQTFTTAADPKGPFDAVL